MTKRRALLIGLGGMVLLLAALLWPPRVPPLVFPDGKKFAFTVIDDTDMATLERLKPVYAVLERYGLKTTKTVWVMESGDLANDTNRGDSLRDPAYRAFIIDLQRKGFEIALHGVRGGSSRREDVLRGLDEFKDALGGYPRMQVNHSLNEDNLYWGAHLYAFPPFRWAAGLAIRHEFSGHEPASPYFWGDVAKERIKYVRRFTYPEINIRSVVPNMPYRLEDKPYVNYWFPTANGDRVVEFHELLKPENLDRLEREGGVCLVYAHLGSGSFNKGAAADQRFETRIRELSQRNGWFVPASQILDFLASQPSWTGRLSFWDNLRLDAKFVAGQFGLD